MANNKRVTLDTLTGEQFKQLIEQFTENGRVDTIPELMERIGEIPDEMSLEDYIKEMAKQSAISPEDVKEVVDDVLEQNASEAYDAEGERLYLFGRPKQEDNG